MTVAGAILAYLLLLAGMAYACEKWSAGVAIGGMLLLMVLLRTFN